MTLTLPVHLTLAQLDDFLVQVREAASAEDLTIDAGGLAQLDTAALQVLVALVRARQSVTWVNTAPIDAMVRHSGLARELRFGGGTT